MPPRYMLGAGRAYRVSTLPSNSTDIVRIAKRCDGRRADDRTGPRTPVSKLQVRGIVRRVRSARDIRAHRLRRSL